MFYHLDKFRGSLELIVLFLETNIFISKCFIISHINVRNTLETYVTFRNCLTNTLKIWPKFKLCNGARYKREYYLKKFSILTYPLLYFSASYSPYLTASGKLEYGHPFLPWISFLSYRNDFKK
jgi:hypothetical protein